MLACKINKIKFNKSSSEFYMAKLKTVNKILIEVPQLLESVIIFF